MGSDDLTPHISLTAGVGSFVVGHHPYIPAMPKKNLTRWRITRIRGSKAELLGFVAAPNEISAIKVAIEDFRITNPDHQKRLVARVED